MNGELSGSIRIIRAMTINAFWADDNLSKFCERAAWVDLCMLANTEDTTVRLERHAPIVVKRGQLLWSILRISKRWKWAQETVSGFLKDLQRRGMIEVRTGRQLTLITIVNYNRYNPPEVSGQVNGGLSQIPCCEVNGGLNGGLNGAVNGGLNGGLNGAVNGGLTEKEKEKEVPPVGSFSHSRRPFTPALVVAVDQELRRLENDRDELEAELGALYAAGDELPKPRREALKAVEKKIAALRERLTEAIG